MARWTDGEKSLEVVCGDITKESVDAIVNAANAGLAGGGGVDGAIHRAGGPAIMEACRAIEPGANGKRCPTGDAVATTAGDLPAKIIIHAVGPVWMGGRGGEPAKLASAHRRSLEIANKHGCRSVAFPAISCGVYDYPVALAAEVALKEILLYLKKSNHGIKTVRYVCFSESDREIFAATLESLISA